MTPRRGFALAVLASVLAILIGQTDFSEYTIRLLNLAAIAAIGAIGLNFAFGMAGLISIGHAAFVGMGAYGSALLSTRMGLPATVAMPIAVAGTGIVSILIGYPLLRLRGHYLALATLGLNASAIIVASNWTAVTGGTSGITSIPAISLFGTIFDSEGSFFAIVGVILATATLIAHRVQKSPRGKEMIAVGDDEIAAAMSGVHVTRVKLEAFGLSASFAALAGCLLGAHTHYISPDDFAPAVSFIYLSMLIVGGSGSTLGAAIGALLITFLPEWLRFIGDAYMAVFGVLMLTILCVMPRGIIGLLGVLRRRFNGRPVVTASL